MIFVIIFFEKFSAIFGWGFGKEMIIELIFVYLIVKYLREISRESVSLMLSAATFSMSRLFSCGGNEKLRTNVSGFNVSESVQTASRSVQDVFSSFKIEKNYIRVLHVHKNLHSLWVHFLLFFFIKFALRIPPSQNKCARYFNEVIHL